MKRAEKFEARLNLYLIKERQNQCAHVELLERNGRSWKSEKPVKIVKELRAGVNGWGESAAHRSTIFLCDLAWQHMNNKDHLVGQLTTLTGAGRPPSAAAEPDAGAAVVARGEAGRPAVENL